MRGHALRRVKTEWEYYYWDETKTNTQGESLRTCMERYGVGGWYATRKDMAVALIFLCADRSAGNAWLLGVKHMDHVQGDARLYEELPRTYHLLPTTALGKEITQLLEASDFERA